MGIASRAGGSTSYAGNAVPEAIDCSRVASQTRRSAAHAPPFGREGGGTPASLVARWRAGCGRQ
jgi:hypothetical protein